MEIRIREVKGMRNKFFIIGCLAAFIATSCIYSTGDNKVMLGENEPSTTDEFIFTTPNMSQEDMTLYSEDGDANNSTINIDLNWAMAPQYDYAQDFSEGLAVVTKNGLAGYINTTGEVVIPFQFVKAGNFSEGFAVVQTKEKGKYGYIDKNGELVIPCKFDFADSFSNGLAAVGNEIGKSRFYCTLSYINTSGDIYLGTDYVIDSYFLEETRFYDEFARISIMVYDASTSSYVNSSHIFINRFGEAWQSFESETYVSPFYEGIAELRIGNKGYFFNTKNEVLFDVNYYSGDNVSTNDVYEAISAFSNGLAYFVKRVPIEGMEYNTAPKMGYFDNNSTEVIMLEENVFPDDFSDELAKVRKEYDYYWKKNDLVPNKIKWSYIDKSGKYLYPYIHYGNPGQFNEGLARCYIEDVGYGYIRSPLALNIVLNNNKLKFNTTLQLSGGMVLAPLEDLCGYLDMNININIETKEFVITKDNLEITGNIDSYTIKVGEEEKEYSVPITTLFGITYVPVDMIADAIQTDTVWDADNSTLTIDTK